MLVQGSRIYDFLKVEHVSLELIRTSEVAYTTTVFL